MQEARFVIDDVAADAPDDDHRLMNDNNDPKTTFYEVQKFFQLPQERIAGRLARESRPTTPKP